jgi:hypothetical protein
MQSEAPKFQLLPIADLVVDARRVHRTLLSDIARWALKNGRAVDLDVIALIIDSRIEYQDAESLFLWTRVSVYSHLWGTAHNYCSLRGGLIPENVGEQMWHYLDYLVDTEQLDERSNPLDALREPLHCYWWLDRDGKTRTDQGPRYAPCRCRVDYDDEQLSDPRFRP